MRNIDLNDLVTNGLVEHRLPLNRVRDEGRAGTYHILDPFLLICC